MTIWHSASSHRSLPLRPCAVVALAATVVAMGCGSADEGSASGGGGAAMGGAGGVTSSAGGSTAGGGGQGGNPQGGASQGGAGGAGGHGGSAGSGGAGGAPVSKRIFVTQSGWNGNFLGKGAGTALENADALCQQAADDALLGGSWVAWLSGGGLDAFDRIANVGPWVLVGSGEEVFADKGSILGGPQVAIRRDEWGQTVNFPNGVWTGTNAQGAQQSPLCAGWSSGSIQDIGRRGNESSTSASWTSMTAALQCDKIAHLYCFEQ